MRTPGKCDESASSSPEPPVQEVAPAAGHDKTGVSFWLDNAGKAIGLIAGIVALGYAVGGLIVTLRMVYTGFSVDDAVGVVGQLPREFVVAAGFVPLGIATVLGGSIWVVVVRPLIGGPRLNNADSTLGKKTDSKARWVTAVDWSLSLGFAGAMAILVLVRYPSVSSAVFVASGVLVAGMALYGAGSLTNRSMVQGGRHPAANLVLTALATVALTIPGAILLVSHTGLRSARVCLTGPDVLNGRLLADTKDRVVLALSSGDEPDAIVAIPAPRVEKIYVGAFVRSACRDDDTT